MAYYHDESCDQIEELPCTNPDCLCDCPGCDTCGTHCIPGCRSGQGQPCTVVKGEDDGF